MPNLDLREWLLTNGLGSFASGTVTDVRTRTYHGWLIAAMEPPGNRQLLLSHLEASLEIGGRVVSLGTNFWGCGLVEPTGYHLLRSFEIDPVHQWIWGENDWQLTRQLLMPHSLVPSSQSLLINYRYEGSTRAVLRLRVLIGDRDFHKLQAQTPELQFSQLLSDSWVCLQAMRSGSVGTPWHLRWSQGSYQPTVTWYWDYHLSAETERGLGDREDLYSPGYLTVIMLPGETVTLEARVGFPDQSLRDLTPSTFADAVLAEQKRLTQISSLSLCDISQQLLQASDRFIVYRASIDGPTVIAGYHWFSDWGRDTLIAIPGLALTPGRFDLARGLLETFGRYCRQGLIPNMFPGTGGEPLYNSIDATLWWIETLGLYLEATEDWEFLALQYPIVQQIYRALITGTLYNIQVDARNMLLGWDAPHVALTWMDAVVDSQPVTPRIGKPVEINALWYSALCWMAKWATKLNQDVSKSSVRLSNQAQRYAQQAEKVKASLQMFWNPQKSYLYDTFDPEDRPNAQIRPNAILALSLHHCAFTPEQGRLIIDRAKSSLLTPYGLRTLDPTDPDYIGQYVGNQEQRDRAYHQGTVSTWLIGAFIRAHERFYASQPLPFDWQPLIDHFLKQACIGSISEIFDGDAPHTPRGAIAQAWSVAEVIRHFQ